MPLRLTFALVPLGTPSGVTQGPNEVTPGPTQLPAGFVLTFDPIGTLLAVTASFCGATPAGGC